MFREDQDDRLFCIAQFDEAVSYTEKDVSLQQLGKGDISRHLTRVSEGNDHVSTNT